MSELLDAADWVYQQMRSDDDVHMVFTKALAKRGHDNVAQFVASEPEEFMALYEACRNMVTEIPDDEIYPTSGDVT